MYQVQSTNQYTIGSLATITVNTLDNLGNPVPPDNLMNPTASLDFSSPSGPINIFNNNLCVAISTTFYYLNIDTTLLSIGSYVVTLSWYVGGFPMTAIVRFDVLPFDGSLLLPSDPISKLRSMLGDMDPNPTMWIWSDQDLSIFVQNSLDSLNAAPARTNWFFFNVPLIYMPNILLYAQYYALNAQAIKIASQAVSFADRNITINKPAQAQLYANLANQIFEKANDERLRIKRQYAYNFGYIGTFGSQAYLSNIPLRAFSRGNWGF